MLETYFKEKITLARLRSAPTTPYLDDFADALGSSGYRPLTITGYLRAAWHFGAWIQVNKIVIASITDDVVDAFARHRRACRCLRRNRGLYVEHLTGVRHLVAHLRRAGVICASAKKKLPDVVVAFEEWMTAHRGVRAATLRNYRRVVVELIAQLGAPSTFYAKRLRAFASGFIARHGRSYANQVITATRMFVRFGSAHGLCDVNLVYAFPAMANWKLSTLHPYLAAETMERLLAAAVGARDRAMLLLLARLGLRAGDIIHLRLDDIDWDGASVRLHGKERRSTGLPLPQDVGDAILRYISDARPRVDDPHVFQRAYPPWGPLRDSASVAAIVARVAKTGGIKMSRTGAHVLRHTLATRLVREGTPLAAVKVLLRHTSEQTTAHYAKLDTPTLARLAQPWPVAQLQDGPPVRSADLASLRRCAQPWPLEVVSC